MSGVPACMYFYEPNSSENAACESKLLTIFHEEYNSIHTNILTYCSTQSYKNLHRQTPSLSAWLSLGSAKSYLRVTHPAKVVRESADFPQNSCCLVPLASIIVKWPGEWENNISTLYRFCRFWSDSLLWHLIMSGGHAKTEQQMRTCTLLRV